MSAWRFEQKILNKEIESEQKKMKKKGIFDARQQIMQIYAAFQKFPILSVQSCRSHKLAPWMILIEENEFLVGIRALNLGFSAY